MTYMRRLMLLRHAKADHPSGVGDHERLLSARGRDEAAGLGRYMAAAGLVPDLAVVSTARRAQQTWDFVRPALAAENATRGEARIYEASAAAILEVIRETDAAARCLLLIGHNPGFQNLALQLIGQAGGADLSRLRQNYPPAGLVAIDFRLASWRDVSEGSGRLERFETPASLGLVLRAD